MVSLTLLGKENKDDIKVKGIETGITSSRTPDHRIDKFLNKGDPHIFDSSTLIFIH